MNAAGIPHKSEIVNTGMKNRRNAYECLDGRELRSLYQRDRCINY
jgi:hypothetical protein